MREGFGYLDEMLPGARCDARYFREDNFTGARVDGYRANRVVGTAEMAAALRTAQARAAARGWGLLLWDAYRPQRAVDAFVRWALSPEDGRAKERHHPRIGRGQMLALGYVAARSGHSRGAAVDLTLFDLATGLPLDMGGDFDLMDERSHHGAAGISPTAAANRAALRAIMESSGFAAYAREWWHYGIVDEPYPDTYFDFPIE